MYFIGLLGRHDRYLQSRTQCTGKRDEFKTAKIVLQDYMGFLWLFVGSRLRFISCLSVLNLRIAGATFDKSSVVRVEIWSQAQTSTALRDWRKRYAGEISISGDMVIGWKSIKRKRKVMQG